MSLENLDFLKSTLLKIDEINENITSKEDIKNGKTMIEMDNQSIEVSLLHICDEKEIIALLETYEWNHNAKGIDALQVELIKNIEYNSLIRLEHFDLSEKARDIGLKPLSKAKTDIAVEIVEKKYDNTRNCDLYNDMNLSELKKMMKLKGLNVSGTKRDLISRKIVSENEQTVNFNLTNEHNEKEVTEDFEKLQTEIKKIEEEYLSKKLKIRGQIRESEIKFSTLMKEYLGESHPETFFHQLENIAKKQIKQKRSITIWGYLVSILVAIILSLFGLSTVFAAITAFAIIIIFGVKNSNRNNDLEISKHINTNDLKEEIERYNKLKKSQKRNLDIELKKINKPLNEIRNKLLILKPIIHVFKVRKKYQKLRMQREKDIEIENKKRRDSINILQSEIDNLNLEKSNLWSEIKHMIPYSNLI